MSHVKFLIAVVMCGATGCGSAPVSTSGTSGTVGKVPDLPAGAAFLDEVPDLPAGVAFVEETKTGFDQPSEHPLLDTPAGTVIDDLAKLSGCWGAYAGPEMVAPLQGDAEFYQFDFESGEMAYQVLQRGPTEDMSVGQIVPVVPGLDVAGEWVYSAAMTGPDRITVRLVSAWASINAVDTGLDLPQRQEVEDAEPFDLQITLEGDVFKIGDSEGASPDFSAPHRANLLFFRFDCP